LLLGKVWTDRWSVKDSVGWYDLSVTCDASPVSCRARRCRAERRPIGRRRRCPSTVTPRSRNSHTSS